STPRPKRFGHVDLNTTLGNYGHRDRPISRPRWTPTRAGSNSNGRTKSFPPKTKPESAPLSEKMNGGGGNRTRVRGRPEQNVYKHRPRFESRPDGRFATDLPPGQPSCGLTPS